MAQHTEDISMNKTLKLKVIRQLQDAAKTYELIANNQRKAGLTKDASVTMIRKQQFESTATEIHATIEESPSKAKPKKKAVKNV